MKFYSFLMLFTCLWSMQATAQTEFITTWRTTTANESITISTSSLETYNYTINWGDGSSETGLTGDAVHSYAVAGDYSVSITGTFPRIFFVVSPTKDKIISIDQWGSIAWTSMANAFSGCTNLGYTATDAPDLSGVTNLVSMFADAANFNGDIGNWNTSTITNMSTMFFQASAFNQDIGNWNTSNVTSMSAMLQNASSFNQDLGGWDVSKLTNPSGPSLRGSGMTSDNYDKLLIGWASQSLNSGITMVNVGINYCHEANARQAIIDAGWTIFDGGQNCTGKEFITTWSTTTANESITIPTFSGETYNYHVDWGDGSSDTDLTGDATHTYTTAGTYTVTITGIFPRIYFKDTGDKDKIQTIEQWGSIAWSAMDSAFIGCSNLTYNASDAPDLSNVTSIARMFQKCIAFDGDLNNWDVSNVTNMQGLFHSCSVFNGAIGNWNVSNVTNMNAVFFQTVAFNQDIGGWNVSNVTNMPNMFEECTIFNQDITGWDVSNVTTMTGIFRGATAFNQDISGWNISKLTSLAGMFSRATSFNQDISGWDMSQVTDMSFMFSSATAFNQDISSWDVSNVTDMKLMFDFATGFNQDISSWNTSKVTSTWRMFQGATSFNQDISAWDMSQVTDMFQMFNSSGLSNANYDAILIGWASQSLKSNVEFGASGKSYCLAATERQAIVNNFSWIITDGGANCTLTNWNGTVWDNGTPTASVSAAINGNYDATINGDIDCENLSVKPGIMLNIPTRDSVTAAGYLMNLGTVTIQDGGSFVQTATNPTNVGTGTYTVERAGAPFRLEYNYWSSPLQSMTMGDAFPNVVNQYTYDASTQAWVATTATTTMTPGQGYIASGKGGTTTGSLTRTFSNTSGFNSGDITHTVSFSNDADATNDWNLIGNPYPSGIDVTSFLNTNYNGGTGMIDNAVYVWNSDGNDVGSISSDYAIMNIAGIANAGGSTAPTSTTIASCQGFMVRSIAAGDVNFQNAHRIGTNNTFLRTTIDKSKWKRAWIQATHEDGASNELLIGFMPDAKIDKDRYDALKLAANPHVSFYSVGGEEKYGIQGLPLSTETTSIPLGLIVKTAGEYSINISHLDQFEGMEIYLYDALTEQSVNLQEANFQVNLAEGEYTNRFFLQVIPQRVTSLEEKGRLNVLITGFNQQLHLQFADQTQAKATIAIYDLMGRKVHQLKNEHDSSLSIPVQQTGVYIVRVSNQYGVMSRKIWIR